MAAPLCIDTKHGGVQAKFGLDHCVKDQQGRSGEQVWTFSFFRTIPSPGIQEFELSWQQDIRPKGRDVCFDVSSGENHPSIILFNCHGILLFALIRSFSPSSSGTRGTQHFVYDIHHFYLLHVASQLCLDCNLDSNMIFMAACDRQSPTQQWKFSSFNETRILEEMKEFFIFS